MVAHRKNKRPAWTDAELLALRPMLAQSRTTPFDSHVHLFELKWDGVRYLAMRLHDDVKLLARKGFERSARYPELTGLRKLPPGTVLDGEVVLMIDGVPSFSALMKQREHLTEPSRIERASRQSPVVYVAFDILWLHGQNVMRQPLSERKELLGQAIQSMESPNIVRSEFVLHHGKAVFEEAHRLNFEGIMAKRLSSAYQPGRRTDDWLKIKIARMGRFEIIGFVPDEDKRWISALLLGEREGGQLNFRGKVGTGFSEEYRRDLFKQLSTKPPLRHPPPGGPSDAEWRDAKLSCEVRFFEMTEDGKLRAPVFKSIV